MVLKIGGSGAILVLLLGATMGMAQTTTPLPQEPTGKTNDAPELNKKGFAPGPVQPYPISNWTTYTFKDGRAVRYDGQVVDTTGFVKGVSLDYGNGGQVRVARPPVNPRDITLVRTDQATVSWKEAAADLATILEDVQEQKQTHRDLEKYVGGQIAAKAVNSMKELAGELRRSIAAQSPSTTEPVPTAVAPQPGMVVVSSDGHRIGTVESINGTQDGRVTALHIASGGFLGFGARLVTIPEGRFTVVGNIVRVEMTADEVSKLPHQGP